MIGTGPTWVKNSRCTNHDLVGNHLGLTSLSFQNYLRSNLQATLMPHKPHHRYLLPVKNRSMYYQPLNMSSRMKYNVYLLQEKSCVLTNPANTYQHITHEVKNEAWSLLVDDAMNLFNFIEPLADWPNLCTVIALWKENYRLQLGFEPEVFTATSLIFQRTFTTTIDPVWAVS